MTTLTDIKTGPNRVEGRAKVSGGAIYVNDTLRPNLAHVAFAGSAIASGRIRAIDTRAAEAAPGVIAVFTHETLPPLTEPGGMREPIVALHGDRIHYADQFIAAVVADTTAAAEAAARLITAEYDIDTPIATLDAAEATAFEPEQWNAFRTPTSSRGDADGAVASAPVQIDWTVETAMRQHNPIEANTTAAEWDGDRVTIWNADQYIVETMQIAARALGIPEENVTVLVDYVGGAYGCKVGPWPHTILTAHIARLVGRPVKMALSRRQMYSSAGHMPATRQRIRIGLSDDGRLQGIVHESLSQGPTHDPQYCEWAAMPSRYLYDCENVRTQHLVAPMHNGAPTTMRAPHEGVGLFALDTALDDVSYRLGIDPVELRLRNIPPRDQHFDIPWSTNAQAEVYHAGMEAFGWADRPAEAGTLRDGDELVGIGMASALRPNSKTNAEARASVDAEGRITVASATSEIGTGTPTALSIVAAEELGLPIERINVLMGDSTLPPAPYVAGSVTMASVGSAVLLAVRALKDELGRIAVAQGGSPLFGADAASVTFHGDVLIHSDDPSRRDTFASIAARAEGGAIFAMGRFAPEQTGSNSRSLGAQFVEVRVDPLIGRIRVSRMLGVFAVGRIISPKTARSQATGGMIWGIGEALMEKTDLDPRTARPVNASFLDNYVPVQGDVPEIDVIFLDDTDRDPNPLGSKSIGEVVSTGVAPAIANAIYHATGKRLNKLPVTSEMVLG